MKSQDEYGAAVHEAGHVVVAWALGLKTRKMTAGIEGDAAAGAAEIEEGTYLPLADQIAICSAGADAQCMLDAPTHEIAAFSDMVRIGNLVDDLAADEGEALRYAGYRRSRELLELHRPKVERLAQALAERTELCQFEIGQILMSDDRAGRFSQKELMTMLRTKAELQALHTSNVKEGLHLEYKASGAIDKKDDNKKLEMARDVSSVCQRG